MTLVYARISNKNVAEQYFQATQAVEAEATTVEEPTAGHRAAARRLLANGHCTRPVELDCRFQTICEGCGFYETNVSSSTFCAANATTPPLTPMRPGPSSTTSWSQS